MMMLRVLKRVGLGDVAFERRILNNGSEDEGVMRRDREVMIHWLCDYVTRSERGRRGSILGCEYKTWSGWLGGFGEDVGARSWEVTCEKMARQL